MAETTTTSGRPVAAVRETRTAAARIRSAVASDEPPYFWTISPGRSGNDVCPPIAERQDHDVACESKVPRGGTECGGDGLNLLAVRAQGQHRWAGARGEGTQGSGLQCRF